MGALVFEPVPIESGFAGRELRQTFNDLLAARGFASAFDQPSWGAQLAPRRRLAFVTTPPVEVDQVAPASMEATRELGRVVDALALTHGGAPRIFAAANEFSTDSGRLWRPLALMVGSGTYREVSSSGCSLAARCSPLPIPATSGSARDQPR
jgi:hypothetical protein